MSAAVSLSPEPAMDRESRQQAGVFAAEYAETLGITVHRLLRGTDQRAAAVRRELVDAFRKLGWSTLAIEQHFEAVTCPRCLVRIAELGPTPKTVVDARGATLAEALAGGIDAMAFHGDDADFETGGSP